MEASAARRGLTQGHGRNVVALRNIYAHSEYRRHSSSIAGVGVGLGELTGNRLASVRHQNGDRRTAYDALGDTAEDQLAQPAVPIAAHDQEAGAELARGAQQRVGGAA